MKRVHLLAAALLFAAQASGTAAQKGHDGQVGQVGHDEFRPQAAQPGAPLPQWQMANGVRYLCGGVGEREQAAMQRHSEYDLKLTFAARTGQYLADVDVDILQGRRNVLSANCDGPIMLVDLPHPGEYQIRASADGIERSRQVTVPSKGHRAVIMHWPLVPDGGLQAEGGTRDNEVTLRGLAFPVMSSAVWAGSSQQRRLDRFERV